MSDNKVIDVIFHCQKQLKKDRLTEDKILHYLGRLSRLRITVQDLAETGIGRTVNSLSRNEGPVGQAADTLVRSWKRMVSEQQSQAEQSEESDSNSGSSEEEEEPAKDDEEGPYEIADAVPEESDHQVNPYVNRGRDNNGHSSAGRHEQPPPPKGYQEEDEEDEDDVDDIDDPILENGYLNLANVHTDDEEEEDEDEENDSDASDRLQIADEEERNHALVDIKPDIMVKQQEKPENYYLDGDRHHGSPQSKYRSHESERHSSSSKSQSSHHHRDRERERNGKGQSSSSGSIKDKDHHRLHSSSSKDRSTKHSSSHSSGSDHKSHHHHHHSSSSSKSDKSKESKSEHHKDNDKHRSKEHRDRDKLKEVKSEKERKPEKEKRDKDNSSNNNSSSGHYKDKVREAFPSSSSYSTKKSSPELKNSEPSHEDRKRKEHSSESSPTSSSKKSKLALKEEIDSTSGLNFEDVLGCLDTSSSKLKKIKKEETEKLQKRHEPHSHKSETSSSSRSSSSSSRKRHESPSKHSRDKPGVSRSSSSSSSRHNEKESKRLAHNSKIESVIKPAVNISPNYKPLPIVPRPINSVIPSSSSNGLPPPAPISISQADLADLGSEYYENVNRNGPSDEVSHEDAISTMLSSRNARSKVYSGVKTTRRGQVPSLYDLCMQVIKDNIGDLGYTGGIPYDILKPALERANPIQLMNIEAQNDYLIGETDELWEFHCKRDFRGKLPHETESWRELYERCKDEQQRKFELIKKQMKRSIASAEPVRKAKLAYVDTSCGPRFNRQKAQTIKNGMKTLKIKEEKGPTRGVSSSASAGFNNPKKSGEATNVKVEEASVIIAPESRAGHAPAPSVSRESTAAKLKPKKAPLMQKTMKLIRSLNRR